MRPSMTGRRLRLIAAVAVTGAVFGVTAGGAQAAYNPNDPAQKAEHDTAMAIGVQAYKYGLPLLDMNRIFSTYTSVNVCNQELGYGPVNQLCSVAQLADPTDRQIVAPNHDTLYTAGWLDLSGRTKYVVRVPSSDRFHVFELLDAYTNNFANIGTPITSLYPDLTARPFASPDGDYIVLGPGQRLDSSENPYKLPVINAPTSRVWIIGRTEVLSPADVSHVNAIQATYAIATLDEFVPGQPIEPKPAPKNPVTTPTIARIPGTGAGEEPIAFFDALGEQLAQFPPPPADAPTLNQFATVGIGPGLHPSTTQDGATLAGLRDAVTTGGPAAVNSDLHNALVASFGPHNGWLVGETGSYGTDYATRAWVDKIGVSALDSRVADYQLAQTDRLGHPLAGTVRYVAHFAPGTAPPPVQGFWSMTLYDRNQFLVPNVANRYLVNDRSNLHYNADGSLDVYIQAGAPTSASQDDNWLPSPPTGNPTNPSQGFNLVMRLYAITPSAFASVIAGGPGNWVPPAILPCNNTTNTTVPGGIACAS